jgi:hypothetical protein
MQRQFIAAMMCWFLLMGATPQGGVIHTVQNGDSLSKIAAWYMPYTAAYTKKELITSIMAINGITGPLSLGQTLRIPVVWNQPLKPKTVPKTKDFVACGVYINPSSAGTRFILDTAYKLRQHGGNTIVFDAKDDCGAITYPSPIPAKYCPNEHYTPNIEELPKLIEYLHRMGIHVVARMVVFKDPIMSRVKPEWCINKEKQWLNPSDPAVQEYILTVVRELADCGLDEIQLDYIRYHADTETGTGVEGVARPDVIAGFLKQVHDITAPKGVLLSMDMFGIVIWQRDEDVLVVGQDIAKLKPYVDIISPMLYPSHFSEGFDGVKNPADDPYRFVSAGVKRMKTLVGDGVIIRPWLQAFPLRVTKGFGSKYILTQIDAARDSGATGWLLWSPGNHYSEAYVAMQNFLKQKLETQVANAAGKTQGVRQQTPSKPALALGAGQVTGTQQTQTLAHSSGGISPPGTAPPAMPKPPLGANQTTIVTQKQGPTPPRISAPAPEVHGSSGLSIPTGGT